MKVLGSKRKNKPKPNRLRTPMKPTIIAADVKFEDKPSMEGCTFQDFFILLYGPPKIGKTRSMTCIPGTYFLVTEPGFKFVKIRKSKIPNWPTFVKFVQKMEKSQEKVKTVKMWVIDTTDNLAKFCMQYVCNKKGIEHPADEEWGKGWTAFGDEFTKWILRLANLGPGICFISHEQDKEIISRSMKITKTIPAMPKTCYTTVNNLVDVILHMDFTKKTKKKKNKQFSTSAVRCVRTKPAETYDAGDRTGALPDPINFKTEQELADIILESFDK